MEALQLLGLVVCIIIVLVFLQYYKQRWPVSNFPPGPTGLPIIGTVLSTGTDLHIHKTATKLAKRYGNVCSFMLDTPMVVVNGYEAITEAFTANKGTDFASRKYPFYTVQLYNPKKLGIFSADMSDRYQQQRRFAMTALRGFGFGKTSFEKKIMNEVHILLDDLKNLPKVPHDLAAHLSVSVSNVMCDILLGSHYDHNDKQFLNTLDIMQEWFHIFGNFKMVLLDCVPIIRPFLKQTAQEMKDLYAGVCNFTMGRVEHHQKTFQADSDPRDFVDCYLAEIAKQPEEFTLEELRYILSDLFSASTDTTANTLKFGLLYMVLNPDVQEKVHQECIAVVGTSRLPGVEDRDHMPYTIAAINEIQRLACVATAAPRCATVDTTLAGYSIPKGTNIVCNLWGLQYDPDTWPEPERFDPNRHLNDMGEVVKHPHLMPFGAGRRVCMGESLARLELFLFFSSLLHRFKFDLPQGTEEPSLEPVAGLTSSPQPYQVVFKEYT